MTTAHRSGVSSTNRRALAYIDVWNALEIARTGSIDFSSIRHIGVTSGAGMSMSVSTLFDGVAGAVIEGVPVPVPAHS